MFLFPFPAVGVLNVSYEQSQRQGAPYQLSAIPTLFSPTLASYGVPANQQQVPAWLRLGFIVPVSVAVVIIVVACIGAYVYIRIDDRKANIKALKTVQGVYAGTLAVGPGKRFQYVPNSGNPSMSSSTAPFINASSGGRDTSCTQSMVSEEGSLSFRYSDSSSEKGRPLLCRPPGQPVVMWAQQQEPIREEDEVTLDGQSNTYETLPFQKNLKEFQTSTPMSSFVGQNSILTISSDKSNNSAVMSPAFPPPPPPLAEAAQPGRSPNIKPSGKSPANGNMFCPVDVHHVASSNNSEANNSDCYDEFHFFSPGPQHV